MNTLSSLGLDGFPDAFFQRHWKIVGKGVCNAVTIAFNSNSWANDLNDTFIALIPKVTKPAKVTEFRPISFCNVMYKILAKVLETN